MKNNTFLYISAAIGAILVFQITYTFALLNPTNVNWLMTVRDDWGTHYLGWFFFRHEPWTFPLGNVSSYYFSPGTNVGFTDSIPIMAIFFKLFASVLPVNFQYFGIWFLLCDLLTAFYTVKLLQLFRIRPSLILISVLLIVSNPVLAYRGMHPALCAHWLLIGSLYYYFLDPGIVSPRKILAGQLLLLLLSAAINPYICFMVLGLTVVLIIRLYFYDKVLVKKEFWLYLGGSVTGILLTWWLIGLINFKHRDELGVGGAYGLYSLNLNSLYNPGDMSAFLPAQKQVSWHQYEGYMYLGFGVILLLATLLAWRLFRLIKRQDSPPAQKQKKWVFNGTYLMPLLILLILCALFAVTHIISINDKVLLRIPLPRFLTNLGDIFRASARFFWLPYYVILFSALIGAARLKLSRPLVLVLFVAALAVQSYDNRILLTFRRFTAGAYTPPLNKSWATLIGQFDHITFYPPFESHQLVKMDYQDFSYLAAEARKTINIGYVARGDGSAMKNYSDSLSRELENGHLSGRALYITTPPYLSHFALLLQSGAAELHYLDGYYYLYARGLKNTRLDTLSERLDSENKNKLDSALAVEKKRTEFVAIRRTTPSGAKPIRYYIERMNLGVNYVSLEGWGFIDSTQNNKGDSIYFTLSTADRYYQTPASIRQRPDLTEAYHRQYLGDGGYSMLAFCDSLPLGEYRLGIAIKDQQGRYIYQEDSTKVTIGAH